MLITAIIDPKIFLLGVFILTLVIWALGILIPNKYAGNTIENESIFKIRTDGFNKFDIIGVILFLMLFSSNIWLPFILSEETLQAESSTEMAEWLKASVFLVAGIMQFLIPSALLLFSLSYRVNPIEAFGLKKANWQLITRVTLIGLLVSLLILFLLDKIAYDSLMAKFFGEGQQAAVESLLSANSPLMLITIGILAVIVAPIGEEILFRGLLHGATKKYTGAVFAIITSSLFFALVHGHATNLFPLFLVGTILAIVYEISGSLWASITLHALFNLISSIAMISQKVNENG